MTKKYRSFMPPGITVLNGITYVVPGWHKVPETTTLEEVMQDWECTVKTNIPKLQDLKHYGIKSNTSSKIYNVTFNGSYWSCNCIGFSFHKKCRHIETAKTLKNSKHENMKT